MMRGPWTRPAAMSATERLDGVPAPRHVPHSGHPIRHIERQHLPRRGHIGVDVHVPEAGDQELAAAVDDPRIGGHAGGPAGPTATIRVPRTTTVKSRRGRESLPSMTVTWVNAKRRGSLGDQRNQGRKQREQGKDAAGMPPLAG
jgi:hypothetical protein